MLKGQPYNRYDKYAQESLYYRGIAYEAKGDVRSAYLDVIDLLRFNPWVYAYRYIDTGYQSFDVIRICLQHPNLLPRSQMLKVIIQSVCSMSFNI